jgi:LysM repeat protein
MTRTMYDSTTAADIPTSAQMVGGYLPPNRYAWSAADWARFPHAVQVRIVIAASTNDGQVLDVEQGDATPTEAPGWARMRRAAGQDPTIYCNASTWGAVRSAFDAAGEPQPLYWIAQYDRNPSIPPGAVAKQYADPDHGSGGHWDLSIVADVWPGVDTHGAAPGPGPGPGPVGGRMYTVQPNDTLSGIGQKFGVDWHQIAAASNIADPNQIFVGQQLTIPGGGPAGPAPGPGPGSSYVVQPNDTLSGIGQKFGVDWHQIAAANNIADPNQIFVGQQLTIPH